MQSPLVFVTQNLLHSDNDNNEVSANIVCHSQNNNLNSQSNNCENKIDKDFDDDKCSYKDEEDEIEEDEENEVEEEDEVDEDEEGKLLII